MAQIQGDSANGCWDGCLAFLKRGMSPGPRYKSCYTRKKMYGPYVGEDDLSIESKNVLVSNSQLKCDPQHESPDDNSGKSFNAFHRGLRHAANVAPDRMLFCEQYHHCQTALGEGMSGTVQLADDNFGNQVAVKTLNKDGLSDKKLEKLLTEVDVYLKMDHPNIAKLLNVINEKDKVYIVMEHCSGGALSDHLRAEGRFSEKRTVDVIRQILMAVNYCHSHPKGTVCHRDLKHDNFLYANKNPGAPLKLIDFGLSRTIRETTQMNGYAGTLFYMAPEVVLQQRYKEMCDMWSIGVIMYSLLCGYLPFIGADNKGIALAIVKGKMSPMEGDVWSGVSDCAKDLIVQLLQYNSQDRPTCQQALQHACLMTTGRRKSCQMSHVMTNMSRFASQTAIRRAAATIAVYVGNQNDKHEQWLHDHFSEIDTDGSGTISEAELVHAMCETLKISEEEGQNIFQRLDTDGDRELHHSEFVAAVTGEAILSRQQSVRDVFNCFDADGDGCITIEELVGVLGETFCGENTEDIFRELDKNGDKTIDQTEFTDAVTSPSDSPDYCEFEFDSDSGNAISGVDDAMMEADDADLSTTESCNLGKGFLESVFVTACSVDSLSTVLSEGFPGFPGGEMYFSACSSG